MGAKYLTDLADILRGAGLVVIEVDGWGTRARSSGGFDGTRPWCVVWHHTASSTAPENDVSYICYGCPDAPVANLYLDRDGVVWVCAGGATNTNGKGRSMAFSSGVVPSDQMNTHAIGVECANDGVGEPYPQAQIDSYFRLTNALTFAYGLSVVDVTTHNEYVGDGRKIDPARAEWVQGPWQPAGINTSGTWSADDIRDECWLRSAQPPEDEVSQAQIDAINARLDALTAAVNDRQAVWNAPIVGNARHANNPSLYLGDLWDELQNLSAKLDP